MIEVIDNVLREDNQINTGIFSVVMIKMSVLKMDTIGLIVFFLLQKVKLVKN